MNASKRARLVDTATLGFTFVTVWFSAAAIFGELDRSDGFESPFLSLLVYLWLPLLVLGVTVWLVCALFAYIAAADITGPAYVRRWLALLLPAPVALAASREAFAFVLALQLLVGIIVSWRSTRYRSRANVGAELRS